MYKDAERADREDSGSKSKIPPCPLFRRRIRRRSDLSMIVVKIRRQRARDDTSCRLSNCTLRIKNKNYTYIMYVELDRLIN